MIFGDKRTPEQKAIDLRSVALSYALEYARANEGCVGSDAVVEIASQFAFFLINGRAAEACAVQK